MLSYVRSQKSRYLFKFHLIMLKKHFEDEKQTLNYIYIIIFNLACTFFVLQPIFVIIIGEYESFYLFYTFSLSICYGGVPPERIKPQPWHHAHKLAGLVWVLGCRFQSVAVCRNIEHVWFCTRPKPTALKYRLHPLSYSPTLVLGCPRLPGTI